MLLSLAIPTASALSCPPPYQGWNPPPGGVLPPNGEVVFIDERGVDPDLDAIIALSITVDDLTFGGGPDARLEARSPDTWALIPLEPLEPGVVYSPGGFTLGEVPDLEPPAEPVATVTRTIDDGSNTFDGRPVDFVSIELEGVEARVELEITEADGTLHLLHRAGSFSFGTAGCSHVGYTPGTEQLTVRARNLDWVGQTSDWVDVPVSGDVPEAAGGRCGAGCSTSPTPLALWTGCLAGLALVRRRGLTPR